MSFTLVPSADGTKADLQVSGVTVLSAYNDGRLFAVSSPSVTDDSKRLTTTELLRDLTLGVDQTWQNPTRTSGVTYYNTTGKPILLVITTNPNSASNINVSGVVVAYTSAAAGVYSGASAIIPPGASYVVTDTVGSRYNTAELR